MVGRVGSSLLLRILSRSLRWNPNGKRKKRHKSCSTSTGTFAYLQRFILTQLREASDPLSAWQIADAWVIDQMIDGDMDTLRLLRKGIGISINTIKHDERIIKAGMDGVCKLWALKKGGN